MKHISVNDGIKKPSVVTNATEVTIIEDAKRHIAKSARKCQSFGIVYCLWRRLQSPVKSCKEWSFDFALSLCRAGETVYALHIGGYATRGDNEVKMK